LILTLDRRLRVIDCQSNDLTEWKARGFESRQVSDRSREHVQVHRPEMA